MCLSQHGQKLNQCKVGSKAEDEEEDEVAEGVATEAVVVTEAAEETGEATAAVEEAGQEAPPLMPRPEIGPAGKRTFPTSFSSLPLLSSFGSQKPDCFPPTAAAM